MTDHEFVVFKSYCVAVLPPRACLLLSLIAVRLRRFLFSPFFSFLFFFFFSSCLLLAVTVSLFTLRSTHEIEIVIYRVSFVLSANQIPTLETIRSIQLHFNPVNLTTSTRL